MAVGELRSLVLDVNDIKEAERFWSSVHVDITVTDVGRAVIEVVKLGGSLVREALLYPERDPLLEQAIVADPFGNEFCLVRELHPTV